VGRQADADKAFVMAPARRHHGAMSPVRSIAALTSDGGGVKRFRDGTHRMVSPDETVARLQPLLPAFGITRVANVTGLDRIGVPVVMVCRPNSRSIAVSQGKGLTLAAAKASGLMEAAEGFHAERIEQPLRLGSSHELARTLPLADVEGLPSRRDSRWHPDLQILWIEATDLNLDQRVWVPYEVVHSNYTHPLPTGSGCFAATTNGLASGNHLLEAICHAICEVVERGRIPRSRGHRVTALESRNRPFAPEAARRTSDEPNLVCHTTLLTRATGLAASRQISPTNSPPLGIVALDGVVAVKASRKVPPFSVRRDGERELLRHD